MRKLFVLKYAGKPNQILTYTSIEGNIIKYFEHKSDAKLARDEINKANWRGKRKKKKLYCIVTYGPEHIRVRSKL